MFWKRALDPFIFRSYMSSIYERHCSTLLEHNKKKPFDSLFSKGYMKQIQGIKDKSNEHDVIRLTWDTQQEQKSSTRMFSVCVHVCMYACSHACVYQCVCQQGCSVTWPVNSVIIHQWGPLWSLTSHCVITRKWVCLCVCVCMFVCTFTHLCLHYSPSFQSLSFLLYFM